MSNIKGIGRIYQQTFVDTYSRVAICKLYTEKTSITAADHLNARVIPFFTSHNIPLLRILTDRDAEYCGKPENHAYQLYLGIEDVDHSRTKAAPKLMAFVSVSIKPCKKSVITFYSVKSFIIFWMSYI